MNAIPHRTGSNNLHHVFLHGTTTCHDDANADCPLAVKPLEIVEVSVKERVLVVPLDFKRNGSVLGFLHVVDFVRDGVVLYFVHSFLDDDLLRHPNSVSALLSFCVDPASPPPSTNSTSAIRISSRVAQSLPNGLGKSFVRIAMA